MPKVVVAFSGGLDTTWCVPHLQAKGYEIHTAFVDVGGCSAEEEERLDKLAHQLGATSHVHIHAHGDFYSQVIKFLIFGNVTRQGYPLCVGAERSIQALAVAKRAQEIGADAIAHGSTAAGNDQVRFEVTLRAQALGLEILAPVRDEAPTRAEQVDFLTNLGLPVPAHGAAYSVNSGLWGVTIGGSETTRTDITLPEDKWIRTRDAFSNPLTASTHTLEFQGGEPVALDGKSFTPVELIEALDQLASSYGIGRGIHLGETILGIKGRVAYEAPAAYVILAAHRELEKLTLTKRQQSVKDWAASVYGELIHEGLAADPTARDLEALLANSQPRVTGQVTFTLRPGSLFVEGVSSPFSLHQASRAVYGESAGDWTSEDAKGFCRIYGLPAVLHSRAGGGR